MERCKEHEWKLCVYQNGLQLYTLVCTLNEFSEALDELNHVKGRTFFVFEM
jgi:hypothetical protein